jgi:hypothetical protein
VRGEGEGECSITYVKDFAGAFLHIYPNLSIVSALQMWRKYVTAGVTMTLFLQDA